MALGCLVLLFGMYVGWVLLFMLRETLFYFSWFVHYHEVPGKYFFFQWTLLQGAAFGVLALTILVSLVNQFLSAFLFSCVVVAVIFLSRESATWQAQAALFLSSGCTFVIFWYSNLYFFLCAGCKCYFRLHFSIVLGLTDKYLHHKSNCRLW